MLKLVLVFLSIVFASSLFSQEMTKESKAIWEETLGLEKASLILQEVGKADTSFEINTTPIINFRGNVHPFLSLDNGNKLLFYIKEKNVPGSSKSVDVYSYTDVKLQDEQLRDLAVPRKYAAIFDFNNSRLIRLENEGEKLAAKYFFEVSDIQVSDQYALLYDFGGDIFTYEKDGQVNEAYSMAQYSWNKGLNCDVYLIYLKDGSRKMIKKNVEARSMGFPFFLLSPDGNYVLSFEDRNYYTYNISTGVTKCISKNLSGYFTSVDFRDRSYNPNNSLQGWKDSATVLVKDTNSDIWELELSGKTEPIKQPRKAVGQTQVNSANPLDSKKEIIKTEEITWKDFNGKPAKGVLAKPKDFDPKKKYPIIFIYYQNSVINPNYNLSYGNGDFVDYGYLVFSPDINYTIGETGKSVFNYVVSAAEYLKKQPYVDAKRMGLRGASFGGYETNYLVTHTNLFAAAISMAGYSDLISNIGSMNIGQRPHQLEGTDQNRLGVTLWNRPDIWIENSPIYYADRVTTPLLLIHSKSDDNVPFEQSLALFRALRSLGKRSWLLQYDDAGHIAVTTSIVGKLNGNCDFCTRQLQFFNHYLKGKPAPLWMLEGIPARLKGIKTGLELDTLGRTPGPGLRKEKISVTDQQKVLLMKKTMITDNGRIIDVPQKSKTNQ